MKNLASDRCAVCGRPLYQNQRTKWAPPLGLIHTVHHEWDQDEDRLIPKP
jgi:hypothetical protein